MPIFVFPGLKLARWLALPTALTAFACGGGGGDGASAAAADTAGSDPTLHCFLEYQSGAEPGTFGLVAQADALLSAGVTAKNPSSPYSFSLVAFPAAGDLSVQATILGPTGDLAYDLMPRSTFAQPGFLFELGAQIPSVRAAGYDGKDHDFDGLRAYCSAAAAPDAGQPPAPDAGTTPESALDPRFFDGALPAEGFFHRQNPDPTKLDVARLDALLAQAVAQGSDALVIAQDDVIIAEKYFGKGAHPATVMSVTKSIVSMAIGALIDEGKIPSVDEPISTYFPEWSTPPKNAATLRHLLTMTGGVPETADFWNHDDLLAFAKSEPLAAVPGSAFEYSNASAMLFAGIISKAAGMSADAYVRQNFFTPIGITDATWDTDAAGNVQTPGGLFMTPLDMLRIGTLASHDGVWGSDRLLSSSWLHTSTANQTPLEACYGFLWWVVRPGCDGENFGTASPSSPVEGFFADGWGGNYIAVIPGSHIVAVRTRYPGPDATPEDELRTRYLAFTQDAAGLAGH
jgi:CubicO group peptidase (beta-lactamase class C family)